MVARLGRDPGLSKEAQGVVTHARQEVQSALAILSEPISGFFLAPSELTAIPRSKEDKLGSFDNASGLLRHACKVDVCGHAEARQSLPTCFVTLSSVFDRGCDRICKTRDSRGRRIVLMGWAREEALLSLIRHSSFCCHDSPHDMVWTFAIAEGVEHHNLSREMDPREIGHGDGFFSESADLRVQASCGRGLLHSAVVQPH